MTTIRDLKPDECSERQGDAMEAIFAFCDAMEDGVSIMDLPQIIKAAVADGHEMMMISVTMLQVALRMVMDEREAGGADSQATGNPQTD